MSSIIGYFDKYGPHQKHEFNKLGVKHPLELRETSFTRLYPKKFKKTFPLVKEIDSLYKKLVPKAYKRQYKKARETQFKVPGTAFTTITTNINFKTFIHTDKGDDEEGFGNLSVIERGKYSGAETCFPQYGIGVNVRELPAVATTYPDKFPSNKGVMEPFAGPLTALLKTASVSPTAKF